MKWFDAWLTSRMVLKLSIAKLRLELSIHEGRVEAVEARQSDLADRFQRFQNRQNMRSAREAMEVDETLLGEAQSILAPPAPPEAAPVKGLSPGKLELWKKRRLS